MLDPLSSLGSLDIIIKSFTIILSLYSLWLPFILISLFWHMWLNYVRADYVRQQEAVLLEIRLPRELTKSPLSMEIVLTALYQTGTATFIETYWEGKVKPWFSLELVSLGGEVHFFIWTWRKYKDLVETQLYAQYPDIEVHEAPDYTESLHWDPENHPFWGTYFRLTDPDVYPIKTYVDYGLDKNPDEEFVIDPITSVIEYLGSMGKGEQVWIQIMMQAHKKEWVGEGRIIRKADWREFAHAEIKKIQKEATEIVGAYPVIRLTKGQELKISAIERSIEKWPFDVGIRGFYIATKEANKIGTRIAGLIGSFRQYSSNNFNGIKIGKYTDFDYKWQDFRRLRRNAVEKAMLEAYKLRSFFQPPYRYYRQKPIILNTEELATIYHFPGKVAATPTFARIPSRKSEAPPNLPI